MSDLSSTSSSSSYSIYYHTVFVILLWITLNSIQYLYSILSRKDVIKCLKRFKKNHSDVNIDDDHNIPSYSFEDNVDKKDNDHNKHDDDKDEDEHKVNKKKKNDKWSIRKCLSNYIESLDKGLGSQLEQRLWKNLPLKCRTIDTEKGINDPLPEWIENVIYWWYNDVNLYRFILFIGLYIIIIYSYQPILYTSQMIMNDYERLKVEKHINDSLKDYLIYHSALDKVLYRCLSFPLFIDNIISSSSSSLLDWIHEYQSNTHIPNDTQCIIHTCDIWNLSSLSSHFSHDYNITSSPSSLTNPKEDEEVIYIDTNQDIHHLLHVLPKTIMINNLHEYDHIRRESKKANHGMIKKVLVKDNVLLDLLHLIDDKGETCICPILIGIQSSNITFLYRKDLNQWSILFNAYLYRNNTLSELIESNPIYQEKSLLYSNFKRYHDYTKKSVSSIHWSVFNIEYDVFHSKMNRVEGEEEDYDESYIQMKKMNRVLMMNDEEDKSILYIPYKKKKKNDIKYKTQERMTLSGDDAICFIYCTNTN